MDLARFRNLGVAAHIDAGKTTVTERILNLCGVERRVGRVDEGTATMDWMAEERERGITITAAATRVSWADHELNIIDTPGHVDFTVEVERCMRVLDGAVLVLDAVAGVQAQSETVWRQMARHGVPCIAFVNKCDKTGADPLTAMQTLATRLGARPLPIQYPIFEDDVFIGVVDLMSRTPLFFHSDGSLREGEVPAGLWDEAEVLRAELLDTLAEEDEILLAAVLDDTEPEVESLRSALRARTLAGEVVPVLFGAALRGIGIQPLLDAILTALPSPLDRPPVLGHDPATGEDLPPRGPDPEGSLTTLAFKLHAGAHGDLTFVRIFAGTLKSGMKLWNPRSRRMERPPTLRRVHADHGEDLDVAYAGDIVALTGCKETVTGDTLCDRAEPIALEPLTFPEPVVALVVEPSSAEDRDKLRQALERLSHEDPSFRIRENTSTGQWTIEGMGELHLEIQIHRLEQEFRLVPRVGKPRVSYRETLEGPGRGAGEVDRMMAGSRIYGSVEVELVPEFGDQPPAIVWAEGGSVIPVAFRSTVAEALAIESSSGPRFGFPLVGGQIRIVGGASLEAADAESAFSQAATQALSTALEAAPIALLEPQMAFEIETPEEFSSGIIADLASRRAEVTEVRSDGPKRTIVGTVPLHEMFGYATAVRSLSQGRADHVLKPAGYTPVPETELESRGLVWS
jgi:elongation factor G